MAFLSRLSIFFTCLWMSFTAGATTVDAHFDRIKQDPQRLQLFLKQMPKGGDLHTHLDGATYAENLIVYAQKGNFCIEENTLVVSTRVNCLSRNKLANIAKRPDLHAQLLNAWSTRDVTPPAPAHFFATFEKFSPIAWANYPSIFAEVANRAAENHVIYLEPMIMPDEYAAGFLGKQIKWDDDFEKMEAQLIKLGLNEQANASAARILVHKAAADKKMQCGTDNAQSGCNVTMRFIYQVVRNQAPTEVFAQLLAGFKAASRDPANIVGINLVQPDDGFYAARDYKLHMKMIAFLKKRNPNVNVTLHAGALTKALTSPENLQFHIRDAIEIAHAKRIGHGISIVHERDADGLLKQMAKNHILVETNLTSSKMSLGVEGKQHPLSLYLQYGVPVALSTDDEGVLRTDITQEYVRAVTQHNLSYAQLKTMARNSIKYSFLPEHEKAQMLAKLDKDFVKFEAGFGKS